VTATSAATQPKKCSERKLFHSKIYDNARRQALQEGKSAEVAKGIAGKKAGL